MHNTEVTRAEYAERIARGALSESPGSQRYGTRYRCRNTDTGFLDGSPLSRWDAPVFQTSALDSTGSAYAKYQQHKAGQRHYL